MADELALGPEHADMQTQRHRDRQLRGKASPSNETTVFRKADVDPA